MQEALKPLLRQVSRFTVVGVVAGIIHIAVAELLLHFTATSAFKANFIAFLISVTISFMGHYHWSFSSDAHKGRAFARFFTVALTAMAVNNILLKLFLVTGMFPPWACLLLAAPAVPVISFVFSRIWAFAPEKSDVSARNYVVALCYAAVAVVLVLPLLAVDHPQSIDLANHLARLFIRHAHSPVLDSFYEFRSMVFPYLAVETIARPLLAFFDIYETGRIILGLAALLWLAAPALLYRALWKQWSLWPLLAALVVYNANTTWGFIDYTITAALGMIALAGWIATENAKPAPRIAAFTVIGFLIYCCHLQGFAVFGLLLGGYELGKMIKDKKFTPRHIILTGLKLAPVFLPAMLHFLYLSITLPPVHRLDSVSMTWADRALTLASPFMYGMHTEGVKALHDISTASAFLLVAAFGLLWHGKNISVHKYMVVAVALLGGLALVIPPQILGISFTHYRLPFVAVILLIACTKPVKENDRLLRILAVCFVAVLATKLYCMTEGWKRYDVGVQEFIAQSKVIKAGDTALVVNRAYPAGFVEHLHTGSYLTIERQAFIPNLFTVMQFFRAKGDYARISHPTATHPIDAKLLQVARDGKDKGLNQPNAAYIKTWWKDFDYVVAYEGKDEKPLMPKQLRPVAHGSFFTIYKVRK